MDIIYQWLDLIWIPIALVVLPRKQWVEALVLIACSAVMLRLQIDMVEQYGKPGGITGWLPFDLYHKGLIAYSLVIVVYIIASLMLYRHGWLIHLSLAIGVFFNAFIISTIVMVI